MSLVLLRTDGGMLTLPDRQSLLVSREDGGNLVVQPASSRVGAQRADARKS